jgi:hypothetical protein
LIKYTDTSFTLSWINKKNIYDRYLELYKILKKNLIENDTISANFNLFRVLTHIEKDQKHHLSNEAYALLKYNTEFLIENLNLPGADEMFDRMLLYINDFFESGEIQNIRVRNKLIKIINKSEKQYEDNKIGAVRNSLNDFKRHLRLYRKEKISNECYKKLKDYADFILYALK